MSDIDTYRLKSVWANALNVGIIVHNPFSEKLKLGFNIDAIGKTWGGISSGVFIFFLK